MIGDDTRIKSSLPTIQYALEQGATVVLASHLGRPKGKPNPEMSLKPIADRLAELLGSPVDLRDRLHRRRRAPAPQGDVVLLENLRFHPEEEKNDAAFAKAAGVARDALRQRRVRRGAPRARVGRRRSRTVFEQPAAGLLMEKELQYLGHALEAPERPFVAIIGGAKVSDKIDVIQNMLGKVDRLIIGGAMAYTFFKSRGVPVGKSLVEDDKLDEAKAIEADAKARGVTLLLPTDHVVADEARRRRRARGARGRRRGASAIAWGSTSGRRRSRPTPRRSPTRRRSSGTARWACSRSTRSRRAPTPSRRRSRR